MKDLVIVDTSAFIEYLRGTADDTLAVLILNNQVLLSPVVRLELFAGVRKKELKTIQKLCNALRPIPNFASLSDCEKLLNRARGTGLFGGIPDLLILTDAWRHNAFLFSCDEKMKKLASKLGINILNN